MPSLWASRSLLRNLARPWTSMTQTALPKLETLCSQLSMMHSATALILTEASRVQAQPSAFTKPMNEGNAMTDPAHLVTCSCRLACVWFLHLLLAQRNHSNHVTCIYHVCLASVLAASPVLVSAAYHDSMQHELGNVCLGLLSAQYLKIMLTGTYRGSILAIHLHKWPR